MSAQLDHRPLEPLVEGSNGDPGGMIGNGSLPTCAIGDTIAAWNDIGKLASRHPGIVIAWLNSIYPNLLDLVTVRTQLCGIPLHYDLISDYRSIKKLLPKNLEGSALWCMITTIIFQAHNCAQNCARCLVC